MEGKLILGKKGLDFFSLLMTVAQYDMTDVNILYILNAIDGSDFNC